MVEQSGFQDIFSLEQGRKPAGSCPICYERVGNECNVVVTPCAHLFCKTCLLQWMRAQNVMMSAHELAMRGWGTDNIKHMAGGLGMWDAIEGFDLGAVED